TTAWRSPAADRHAAVDRVASVRTATYNSREGGFTPESFRRGGAMPGIGETLREARLSRGLTHDYISQIIKIRPEFLSALEDEDFESLPGNFYAKNFLRRYSDFLGLDSAALVDQFVNRESRSSAEQTQAFVVAPVARQSGPVRHWRPNFGLLLGLLVLVAAATTLAYAALQPGSPGPSNVAGASPTPSSMAVALMPTPTSQQVQPAPTPSATEATAVATPGVGTEVAATPTVKPQPSATVTKEQQVARSTRKSAPSARTRKPTATKAPTPTPKPTSTARPKHTPTPRPTATRTPVPPATGAIVASIRTTVASGVTVRSDGRTVFSGTVSPGSSRQFGANALLYVYSTSAQNVLVSVNRCAERTLDAYGCPGCTTAYYTFPRSYYDCR
ncbi:MAG: helix-turn-helix domain-containing protein, partial [Chloroflexota bacterium]|nr:helix-turn-helix domain-containing protein [Chloroflexota bacterium]